MEHDPNALTRLNELIAKEREDDDGWTDRGDNVRDLLTWCMRIDKAEFWEGGHAHLVLPDGGEDRVWDDDHGVDMVNTDKAREIKGLIEGLNREELTELTLSLSLCPIHFCDYACCFDDQDPDCKAVRLIHPGHDT